MEISTLSKLTDYYYFISKDIQKNYLSTLFILKPIKEKSFKQQKTNFDLFNNKDKELQEKYINYGL